MSDLPLPEPVEPQVLDIQHDTDPAEDHSHAKRIPHLGHAILFFFIAVLCLLICIATFAAALHITPENASQHPMADLMAQMLADVMTFALAFAIFPLIWQRSFLDGIHWVWRVVQRRWWQLLLLGIGCSIVAQLLDTIIKTPTDSELLKLFQTPLSAWIVSTLGAFLFPLTEEVAFRGFLLPALATAYEWLALERTPAGLDRWQRTTSNSLPAWIFGAFFSSIAFASLHGAQLHWARGPLLVLFAMSLVFSAVRIRTRSVAAAVMVHIAYDGLIFLQLCIATGGYRHLDKLKL